MMKILLVEDSEFVQHAFSSILKKYDDCYIEQAYSLKQAKCFFSKQYDIIFVDLKLPDGDGMEFIHCYCRYQQENKKVPIVVQTAFYSVELCRQLISVGANKVLIKPISMEQIVELVDLFGLKSK